MNLFEILSLISLMFEAMYFRVTDTVKPVYTELPWQQLLVSQ